MGAVVLASRTNKRTHGEKEDSASLIHVSGCNLRGRVMNTRHITTGVTGVGAYVGHRGPVVFLRGVRFTMEVVGPVDQSITFELPSNDQEPTFH